MIVWGELPDAGQHSGGCDTHGDGGQNQFPPADTAPAGAVPPQTWAVVRRRRITAAAGLCRRGTHGGIVPWSYPVSPQRGHGGGVGLCCP